MTNREWLNTLSDEDQGYLVKQKFAEIYSNHKYVGYDFCQEDFDIIADEYIDWLSQPHETTADEDFLEIGFEYVTKNKYVIIYGRGNQRLWIGAGSEHICFNSDDMGEKSFDLSEAKLISDISNKKRNEMGWQQWTKF